MTMTTPRIAESQMTSGRLTIYGKRLLAESMYAKGKSFIGAALLLRQRGGYEYVVLHLLCQGIDIMLKPLLLWKEYDKYHPRLKKFGHHLAKLVNAAQRNSISIPHKIHLLLAAEIETLDSLYSSHRLRYGTFYGILVDPTNINSSRSLRRIAAVIRLADRHVRQG
jgi:hypothetical protein